MDGVLRSIFYDVRNPAGFSSINKLHAAASQVLPGISINDVNQWLRGETTYTLHRNSRRYFKRNPVISHCIGEWCQSDVVDVQAYAKYNEGNRYLLTFIDVFSKKATAKPMKTKAMNEVASCLDEILSEFICFNLLTDRGLEFKNRAVQKIMDKYGTRLRFSHNEAIKACVAERFNRTLRGKMHKYFTSKGTRKYIDILDDLIYSYNHSHHRSIKMRPVDVTAETSSDVFRNLYGVDNERSFLEQGPTDPARFKIGDVVRRRYYLPPLEHSYFPTFTDMTFTVSSVILDHPRHMYRLRDWEGSELPQKFYAEDLLRVSGDVKYRIEKVLKRRKDGQCFVKWTGYPSSANSWVRKVEDHV